MFVDEFILANLFDMTKRNSLSTINAAKAYIVPVVNDSSIREGGVGDGRSVRL